jgi:hypothetical protein
VLGVGRDIVSALVVRVICILPRVRERRGFII